MIGICAPCIAGARVFNVRAFWYIDPIPVHGTKGPVLPVFHLSTQGWKEVQETQCSEDRDNDDEHAPHTKSMKGSRRPP